MESPSKPRTLSSDLPQTPDLGYGAVLRPAPAKSTIDAQEADGSGSTGVQPPLSTLLKLEVLHCVRRVHRGTIQQLACRSNVHCLGSVTEQVTSLAILDGFTQRR
jgi:hypothetical protein